MTSIPRRHHNKVRTGCQTCKTRRVKCDERKPTCQRCDASHRPCGYEPLRTWLFEPHTEERRQELDTAPFLLSSPPLNYAEPSELRALSFFRERTSPSLSAFSKFTKQFWNQIIPPLIEAESSVRYMTIALATRQELLNCPSDRLYNLSLVRSDAYSTTVGHLTQPDCSLVAVLLCCLFFIGYECMQDPMDINPDTSVRHLGAGLRILEEHQATNTKQTEPVTQIIQDYLEPMFLQMEMMFSMFNTPIHTIRDTSTPHIEAARPNLPSRFRDLLSARKIFHKIYRWHYVFRAEGNKQWTPTSSAFRAVREVFLNWYALVMAYNDTLENRTGDVKERQDLMTMSLESIDGWDGAFHSLVVRLLTSTDLNISINVDIDIKFGGRDEITLSPHGGRLKTSIVDLMDPDAVTVTFIVDARSLAMLEVCDWTETGLSGNPALRIWPVAEVRRLEDGSGRGIVRLRMRG